MKKSKKKTKYCWDCKRNRKVKFFSKDKRSQDKLNGRCKECDSQYKKINKKHNNIRRRQYRRSNNGRYSRARYEAKRRRVKWKLTKEEYLKIIDNDCYYCGGKLPDAGIGLDRKNNNKSIGYTKKNVIPCCTRCNQMRNNWVSVEEFKVMINALKKYQIKKK